MRSVDLEFWLAGSLALACSSSIKSPKVAGTETTPGTRSPEVATPGAAGVLSAAQLFAQLESERTVPRDENSPDSESDPEIAPDWPNHCRSAVKYPDTAPLESCDVRLLGNGSTLILSIVTACGGDSCDVASWVYTRTLGRFVALPRVTGGTMAADPTGEFLLVDESTGVGIPSEEETIVRDPFGGQDEIITARISLPSMTTTPFAACFSPALSPGGRWFVCRNRSGDVLRVAAGGGKPELVVKSGVAPEDLRWVPYAYGYPDAVEFLGPTRLRYTLEAWSDEQGGLQQREAAWSE